MDKKSEVLELDVEGTTYEPIGRIRFQGGCDVSGTLMPVLMELGKVCRVQEVLVMTKKLIVAHMHLKVD